MAMPKVRLKPFTMVRRSIWDSRRFGALPDDPTRFLYLYLLTCQHQTGTGCFMAKEAYVLGDLAKPGTDWTAQTLAARKQALVDAGLIFSDEQTGEILIAGWWNNNGPSNGDWYKGAQRQCEVIESESLRNAALDALEAFREAAAVARGMPVGPVARRPAHAVSPQDRIQALTTRIGDGP